MTMTLMFDRSLYYGHLLVTFGPPGCAEITEIRHFFLSLSVLKTNTQICRKSCKEQSTLNGDWKEAQ